MYELFDDDDLVALSNLPFVHNSNDNFQYWESVLSICYIFKFPLLSTNKQILNTQLQCSSVTILWIEVSWII